VGQGVPQKLAGGKGGAPLGWWENSTWASRERVLLKEYAHPAKLRYVPQPK